MFPGDFAGCECPQQQLKVFVAPAPSDIEKVRPIAWPLWIRLGLQRIGKMRHPQLVRWDIVKLLKVAACALGDAEDAVGTIEDFLPSRVRPALLEVKALINQVVDRHHAFPSKTREQLCVKRRVIELRRFLSRKAPEQLIAQEHRKGIGPADGRPAEALAATDRPAAILQAVFVDKQPKKQGDIDVWEFR